MAHRPPKKTKKLRVLFILKHRDCPYSDETPYSHTGGLSSGLWYSAKLISQMLSVELGHTTSLVHAVDNNEIDRLVTDFNPDICIIEAYWVVPEKFTVLTKLHPRVLWVIRNHSAAPFLALEGSVMGWSLRYMDFPNIVLGSNDSRTTAEFQELITLIKPTWSEEKVAFRCRSLPNYYPAILTPRKRLRIDDGQIDISSFGAIRPLKNQLIQAIAAIKFADRNDLLLRFHINSTRIEQEAGPVLKNLRSLFAPLEHKLIEHPWMVHEDFVQLCRQMDVAMQVSFSETFNIATADCVTNGVPVVVSPDISWVDWHFQANPTSSDDIASKIAAALNRFNRTKANMNGLEDYDNVSRDQWKDFIQDVIDNAERFKEPVGLSG